MVDIVANPEWKSVRILERDEVALGGYGGNMNEHATSLVARSEFLKQKLDGKVEQTYVDDALAGLSNGSSKFYPTLELANADIANLAVNQPVNVGETENGGLWYKATAEATTLTKSPYDPLSEAQEKINDVVLSYDFKTSDSTRYIVGKTDSQGKILWGYDTEDDKFIAGGLNSNGEVLQTKQYKYFEQKPVTKEINHVLGYGQSLSVGATATTILSTTQPYSNKTFNTSPRQDIEATSVIPLVEQFNSPSADGYTNRGETHCSGAANYASLLMLKENIDPQDHVIFASTGGHGGATIGSLAKGGVRYTRMMTHVTKAKELNAGKTYHVPVVQWIQGENNASSDSKTPYSDYKAALIKMQLDMDEDIKAVSGQTDDIRFITYQLSCSVATWSDIAKAQLDIARENDNFMMATPMYHFPYASDQVHLTNVGYKWMGAYFGRAYKQYMIEGRKSDFINPLSAYLSGNKVFIKFDVPKLPLKIDHETLASTTDSGFKVVSGGTAISITKISADKDTVVLELASTPSSSVQVRYALDYLGTGLNIINGASGNLRDSTDESVIIGAVSRPLYHVCPHFELTAYLDKGI